MAAEQTLSGVTALLRAEMVGESGPKSLRKNKKVFFVAVFAS